MNDKGLPDGEGTLVQNDGSIQQGKFKEGKLQPEGGRMIDPKYVESIQTK